MKNNLTDQDFWDKYWKKIVFPIEVNMNISFDRCISKELKKIIPKSMGGKTVFEIGCAPGKWLAYLKKEFNMIPCGIEYSLEGYNALKKNFLILNIDSKEVLLENFLTSNPIQKHDVVISLGFIEHFQDVDNIIEKHLRWLKPGGILILGVPNFNGINKHIQKVLSLSVLEKHNLSIMQMSYFEELQKKFNIILNSASYLGSFEPTLFIDENENPNIIIKLINKTLIFLNKVRKIRFFDNLNSRYFSSYILVSYKNGDI